MITIHISKNADLLQLSVIRKRTDFMTANLSMPQKYDKYLSLKYTDIECSVGLISA